MPPKATTAEDLPPSSVSTISGKLLIIGILVLALVAAAASWWFRHNATHRAAKFWGPEAAILIRDAPNVELLVLQPADGNKQLNNLLQSVILGGQSYLI